MGQAEHLEYIRSLEAEVKGLQQQLHQKQVEIEESLREQAAHTEKSLEEVDQKRALELQRFEELRQQKVMAIEEEARLAQQKLQESEISSRRQLQQSLEEEKIRLQARYKLMKSQSSREMQDEQQSVLEASERAHKWEKQAQRLKRSYVSATFAAHRLRGSPRKAALHDAILP